MHLRARSTSRVRTVTYRTLVVVSLFQALSAVGGGVGMVVADGLSMPKSLLAHSPFSTFLVPGLILTLAVGGTQTLASVRLLQHRRSALLCTAVAGFGMLIWIIAEIGFIQALTWAQLIYVVSGLLQLLLVFALLGVVDWLPRDPRAPTSRTRVEPGPAGSGTVMSWPAELSLRASPGRGWRRGYGSSATTSEPGCAVISSPG